MTILNYMQQNITVISLVLILNHIIVIYNVFEIFAANKMMFFKIDEDLWPSLKSFLIYLNYLPENNQYSGVTVDLHIARKLQTL